MLKFVIPSMSCGHCVKNITQAITLLDANATVSADPASKQISVTTRAAEAAVIAALTEAGYAPAS